MSLQPNHRHVLAAAEERDFVPALIYDRFRGVGRRPRGCDARRGAEKAVWHLRGDARAARRLTPALGTASPPCEADGEAARGSRSAG